MSWTAPRTWTTSLVVTAAMLNTDIRDNENFLRAFHGTRVYSTSATIATLSDGVDTALTWNAEEYDTDAFHDTATNNGRLTVPTGFGGYFALFASIAFAANATGSRRVHFRKNGTTDVGGYARIAAFGGAPNVVVAYAVVNLIAADYIECLALQNSGAGLAVNGGAVTDSTFGWEYRGS